MRRVVATVAASVISGMAIGAAFDDAREDRWAQEVVPGIVVGDAVFLATSSRAKVLAILTLPPARPGAASSSSTGSASTRTSR